MSCLGATARPGPLAEGGVEALPGMSADAGSASHRPACQAVGTDSKRNWKHGGTLGSRYRSIIPMKVLVADDNADSRELIRTVLEQSGHLIFEASDGIEAVRCAHELLPDLIVLDLHMPSLDGFEVLQELRRDQRFASTPIVALTASAMEGDRERTLSKGFTSYIAKPISLIELRDEIERFLR